MIAVTANRQGGMTAIGWLIVLGLIAFFALLTLKITPLYLEYFRVVQSVEKVANDPPSELNKGDLLGDLHKQLYINEVRSLHRDQLAATKGSKGWELSVKYDATTNLFGNLDLVAHFQVVRLVGSAAAP